MIKISKKDKDKIIEDYLNGVPVSETAKSVGRSKSTIYNIVKEEGLTKEDFGRNIHAITITDDEEKSKTPPKPKLDDTSTLYDLFNALGIEENINMQLFYCIRSLSKEAGMNAGDYIKEIVIPLMLNTLKDGLRPDSDSIDDFLQKTESPEKRLHEMYVNEAIEDFEKKKKGESPEELTPEEELKQFELEASLY